MILKYYDETKNMDNLHFQLKLIEDFPDIITVSLWVFVQHCSVALSWLAKPSEECSFNL